MSSVCLQLAYSKTMNVPNLPCVSFKRLYYMLKATKESDNKAVLSGLILST